MIFVVIIILNSEMKFACFFSVAFIISTIVLGYSEAIINNPPLGTQILQGNILPGTLLRLGPIIFPPPGTGTPATTTTTKRPSLGPILFPHK